MKPPSNIVRATDHPRAADIQNIRNLLRGYGSTGSLLKEMVQNAIDANAQHLCFTMIRGDKNAPHPLFRTDCLCIVNDGPFSPANLDAIFRMNVGTKAHESHSIGRFGLGIKSLFWFCEAFFICANADSSLGWDGQANIPFAFYNPAQSLRYQDWDEAANQYSADIQGRIADCVTSLGSFDNRWLALWLPLRTRLQSHSPNHFIEKFYPAEDEKFFAQLREQLQDLCPSLFFTNKLATISLVDQRNASEPIVTWQRHEFQQPASVEQTGIEHGFDIKSSLSVNDNTSDQIRSIGWSGVLADENIGGLKRNGWPQSTTITSDGEEIVQDVKAEPHFAVTVSHRTNDASTLSIVWSVFLPVGEQPTGKVKSSLPSSMGEIVITLHGYFFLDSERRRIDALEKSFTGDSSATIYSRWNALVCRNGTLAAIPQALAEYCHSQTVPGEHCAALAKAIKETWLWQQFSGDICAKYRWLPRLTLNGSEWTLIASIETIWAVPEITDIGLLVRYIPNIKQLIDTEFVISRRNTADSESNGLGDDAPRTLLASNVEWLVESVNWATEIPVRVTNWINTLVDQLDAVPDSLRDKLNDLPLIGVRVLTSGSRIMQCVRVCRELEADVLVQPKM
ncbi:sacsin N-terminal ATP-binding-like domain-containing protein [Aureliella helgolandensis]|uniref:sacsin N-terminal ATP-binding-like domain-containing protein n=1 Tax=Aureliella helgolandensis TaxID=2527968 RepID=UPI00119CB101|nr:hypothetical protein [Aureliella helgolandensis]